MPFRRKPTGRTEKHVPAEVDFDALWERVYQPVLRDLGYRAVRADRDAGALIITQMIQRLAIADVVVADITLANANVYYEIGIRHAAKERGCVLIAADWARPVFDLDQMRQLRFPLTDGTFEDDEAVKAAVDALRTDLMGLVQRRVAGVRRGPGLPGFGLAAGVGVRGRAGRAVRVRGRHPGGPRHAQAGPSGAGSRAAGEVRHAADDPRRPWPSSCCDWSATSWAGRTF